jgi:hypothetical protein
LYTYHLLQIRSAEVDVDAAIADSNKLERNAIETWHSLD